MEKLRVSSIYREIWGSLSRPPRQICGGGDYIWAEIAYGDFRRIEADVSVCRPAPPRRLSILEIAKAISGVVFAG
jgi:hypothetical protein